MNDSCSQYIFSHSIMFRCLCQERFMTHVCSVIHDMEVQCGHWKENELALHQAETRMIGWIYGVKLRDTLSCVELRQQLGIADIVKVLQRNTLCWREVWIRILMICT